MLIPLRSLILGLICFLFFSLSCAYHSPFRVIICYSSFPFSGLLSTEETLSGHVVVNGLAN